jgi:hypothetical protein
MPIRARAVGSGSTPAIRPCAISSRIFSAWPLMTGSRNSFQARLASRSWLDASASARSSRPCLAYSAASASSAARPPAARFEIAQKCGREGLRRVRIDIDIATTPAITG